MQDAAAALGLGCTTIRCAMSWTRTGDRREARAGTALALAASGLRSDDRPGKIVAVPGSCKGRKGFAAGLGCTATPGNPRSNAAVSVSPQLDEYGAVRQ